MKSRAQEQHAQQQQHAYCVHPRFLRIPDTERTDGEQECGENPGATAVEPQPQIRYQRNRHHAKTHGEKCIGEFTLPHR